MADTTFDPNAAAAHAENLYGLPADEGTASVIVVPVPFDATSSYGTGSKDGPAAILRESLQVDLLDRRFGRVYQRGLYMQPIPAEIAALSDRAAALTRPIIDRGGATDADAEAVRETDDICWRVNEHVHERVRAIYEAGKTPGVVGGEHGVAFGAYRAAAEVFPGVGILQIDAHLDLRPAFEGFRWSHASIMHNVLTELPGVARIVQVGIRDFCEQEAELAEAESERIRVHFADDLADERFFGTPFRDLCERIIDDLPPRVFVNVDIDGLEPSLSPNTGTPVPGGLSWDQFSVLLQLLRDSDREVVGFDLVEVSPSPLPDARPIDAAIGARVLYRLCGLAG